MVARAIVILVCAIVWTALSSVASAANVLFDELRVGTDWASATAIPEPSPFFVLLLMSGLIAAGATSWKLLGKCA